MKLLFTVLILVLCKLAMAENLFTTEWKYPADQGWYPDYYGCPSKTDRTQWRKAYETCYKKAFVESGIKVNYLGVPSQVRFQDLYEKCMWNLDHFVHDGSSHYHPGLPHSNDQTEFCVRLAIKKGYRSADCASFFINNCRVGAISHLTMELAYDQGTGNLHKSQGSCSGEKTAYDALFNDMINDL